MARELGVDSLKDSSSFGDSERAVRTSAMGARLLQTFAATLAKVNFPLLSLAATSTALAFTRSLFLFCAPPSPTRREWGCNIDALVMCGREFRGGN